MSPGRQCVRERKCRQYEEAVAEIHRCEARSREERRTRADLAKEAADDRPEHEAESERGADHAEGAAPVLGLGHVRNIGIGG